MTSDGKLREKEREKKLEELYAEYDAVPDDPESNRLDRAAMVIAALRVHGQAYEAYHLTDERAERALLRREFEERDAAALGKKLNTVNESLEVLVDGQVAILATLDRIAEALERND